MWNWESGEITRPGVPPDTSALIETVIDEDLARCIYAYAVGAGQWHTRFGMELLDFGGGEFGISVEMMLSCIPESELAKIRGIGKKRAAKIYAALKHSPASEPGY